MRAACAERISWLGGFWLLALAATCPAQNADVVSDRETPQLRCAKQELDDAETATGH